MTALDPQAMLWSPQPPVSSPRPLLIMMHGAGGVEQDMSQYFPLLPSGLSAVSLRGPVALRDRWAWLGDPDQRDAAARLDAMVRGVLAWVETLADFAPIGLLGFSQGGAMAVQLMRYAPERFACVIHLAAFVLPDPVPTDAELQGVRPPVFTGHGALDDVIAADRPFRGVAWLRRHTTLTERTYAGVGHEMSQPMLDDAMRFAEKHLGR